MLQYLYRNEITDKQNLTMWNVWMDRLNIFHKTNVQCEINWKYHLHRVGGVSVMLYSEIIWNYIGLSIINKKMTVLG